VNNPQVEELRINSVPESANFDTSTPALSLWRAGKIVELFLQIESVCFPEMSRVLNILTLHHSHRSHF